MKRLRIKRSWVIATGVVLFAGLSIAYVANTVYATINNDLPAAADMEAGGRNGYIELHLKKLDVAQVIKNKMSAYYPTYDTSANGKSIKITAGPMGRICHVDEAKLSGEIEIYIKIANNDKTYHIPIDRVCDTGDFYGQTFDFPNGTLYNDPGINRTRADITVRYQATPQLPASSGSDLNYEMHLTGNNSGNGELALRSNDAYDEFGLRSSYADNPSAAPNNDVRARVSFGYPCNTTFSSDATNRQVKVYDADAVFGDTYMWIEKNGVKLNQSEYGGSDRNISGWDAGNKRWKLQGSNNDYNMLSLNRNDIEVGEKYELVVFNNGNGGSLNPHFNTLSVGTPQDSIYSKGNCKYELHPHVSIDTSTYVYYPNIQVTGWITESPSGPIPEAHPWEIYTVRYPGEPSTRNLTNSPVDGGNPCTNGVLPAGGSSCGQIPPGRNYTAQSSLTVPYTSGGPDAVGTRLCFFTRIKNPTHLIPDDDQWVYSDLECAISAKKPRVQFLGSDLRVGGNVTSSYYPVQGNKYGSWVEYGAFVAGVNSMATSGNGLRGGSNAADASLNRLSFANTPSYGGYSPLPPASSAYTYFRGLPTSGGSFNQGNPTSGVYDFGGSTNLGNTRVTANGRSIIIRKTGTLQISNNIEVDNNGVTGASNLSQIVIVADNIDINQNVDRIDAWLITGPNGRINTCDNGAATLTSNICNGQLTVNGPIYTRYLMLRRTAGANPPGPDQLSQPAERFNLRPDAQLWAYTYANRADFAQTDFVQELPPRY